VWQSLADAHGHSYGNCYSDGDSRCIGNGYGYGYGNGHSHGDCNCDCDCAAEVYADA